MHLVVVPHPTLVPVGVLAVVVVVDVRPYQIPIHVRSVEYLRVGKILAEPTNLPRVSIIVQERTKLKLAFALPAKQA